MSQGILLVVDNESDAVIYGGREWQWSYLSRWYGGSSTWPAPAPGLNGSSEITYGSLNFSFHGTAVAFYGNTATRFQNATVSIDGGPPYSSSFPDPSSQKYLQWYQSPQLQEGNHTISLTNLADVSVDFIVVAAGPNTPLSGQTVIVDDDNPSIHYTGSWDRDGGLFSPDPSTSNPSGYPFHNGTHQSSTEGDVLTLEFTGTSINVFGIFDFSTPGSLSAIFDLDGQSTPLTYVVEPDTPEFNAGVGYQPNFHYFSQSPLAGGNHTLTINITQSHNIPFILDYITYHPSSPTEGNAEIASSSPSPSVIALLPTSPPKRASESTLVGPIAGSVVGALAVIVIIALTCRCVRRRNAARLGTRPPTDPDPDWHPLRSRAISLSSLDARSTRTTIDPEADVWSTSKAPQSTDTQDQIWSTIIAAAELERICAERGDVARGNSHTAQPRAIP